MKYYIGTFPVTPYLEHFGIPGMRWGFRRYQNEDGTLTEAGKARYLKQIDNDARRDAQRWVNAKQYYGKGAGTRRKLLKGELSKKMQNADYKKAFDSYVKNGDYEGATRRAKMERGARDTAANVKRAIRIAAPIAIAAAGIYYAANKQKVDAFILRTINKGAGMFKRQKKWDAASAAEDFLNKNRENINRWRNMHR